MRHQSQVVRSPAPVEAEAEHIIMAAVRQALAEQGAAEPGATITALAETEPSIQARAGVLASIAGLAVRE